MADIMNPTSPPRVLQPQVPQTSPLSNPFATQTNPFRPNYNANPFPPYVEPTQERSQETSDETGQQQEQRDYANSDEAEDELASRGSRNPPLTWRFRPGDFRDAYAAMPSDAGSYGWSDLAHPDRRVADVKLPLPAPFNDREDDVEAYINRVSFFISLHENRFRANADQVYLFLQGCSAKDGQPWAAGIMKQYLDERRDMVRYPEVANLQQVTHRFRARFGVIDKARAAQAKLEVLQQGQQPVRTYVAAFEKLAQESGYNSTAQMQTFRRGLDIGLRRKIDDMADRPQTISRWKEVALNKDASMRAEREEEKAWSSSSFRKPTTAAPKNTTSAHTQDTASVSVQAARLSEEERTRYLKEGRCFRCHVRGHMARFCPEKDNNTQATNSSAKDTGVDALLAQLLSMEGPEKEKIREMLKDF